MITVGEALRAHWRNQALPLQGDTAPWRRDSQHPPAHHAASSTLEAHVEGWGPRSGEAGGRWCFRIVYVQNIQDILDGVKSVIKSIELKTKKSMWTAPSGNRKQKFGLGRTRTRPPPGPSAHLPHPAITQEQSQQGSSPRKQHGEPVTRKAGTGGAGKCLTTSSQEDLIRTPICSVT